MSIKTKASSKNKKASQKKTVKKASPQKSDKSKKAVAKKSAKAKPSRKAVVPVKAKANAKKTVKPAVKKSAPVKKVAAKAAAKKAVRPVKGPAKVVKKVAQKAPAKPVTKKAAKPVAKVAVKKPLAKGKPAPAKKAVPAAKAPVKSGKPVAKMPAPKMTKVAAKKAPVKSNAPAKTAPATQKPEAKPAKAVDTAPVAKAKAPVAKTPTPKPVVKKSIVAPITFRQEDTGPVKFVKEPSGKFEMEFVIRASEDMVFEFVSTESGLSEWFCDDVTIRNGIFTFMWDGQVQQAKLVKELPPSYIRYQWLDKNDGSYFEFKTQKDELTNDISLIITDFASDKSDEESARLLWNSQVDKLLHVLGSFF